MVVTVGQSAASPLTDVEKGAAIAAVLSASEKTVADDPRTIYGLWNEYQYSEIEKVALVGNHLCSSCQRFMTAGRWRATTKMGRDFMLQFDMDNGTVSVMDKDIMSLIFYTQTGIEVYFRKGKKWSMLTGAGGMSKALEPATTPKKKVSVTVS